jgi:DNA-binding Lrp family transcriptional regulator
VVLDKKEKEQLVIKLYQEDKPIREIAQQAHLSFGTIGKIIRRINGDENNKVISSDVNNKSKATQALNLFLHGKRPVEVAIELDLSASEVQNMLEEFWALNDLHELAFVYNEIKTFLPLFLKLFHCLKERRMLDEKHISNILRYVGTDLPQLTDRVQCLTNDVINLEGQKRNLMNKLILWNAQLCDLGKAIDIKNQQLKRMDK